MKKAPFFIFAILVLSSVALYSCSFKIQPTVSLRLEVPRSVAARNPELAAFSLYLVAFRGNIPNTLANSEIGGRSPSCLGWSGFVTTGDYDKARGQDQNKAGMSANLPQGIYEVQFFGIKGTGTTLTQLFANSATPEVYPLTAATTIDTTMVSSKALPVTYSGSTADTLPGCQPQLNGLQIAKVYSGPSGSANSSTINYETFLLNPPLDFNMAVKSEQASSSGAGTFSLPPSFLNNGLHMALDYFTTATAGSTVSDFTVNINGEQGNTSYTTVCGPTLPSGQNDFGVAIYNSYLGSWQQMTVTQNSIGATASYLGAVRAYYNFQGYFVFSVRSREWVNGSCPYLKINEITFHADSSYGRE